MSRPKHAANHIEVYRDRAGLWRWHAIARNGNIVADSGQSYTRRWSAKRAARKVMPGWPVIAIRPS